MANPDATRRLQVLLPDWQSLLQGWAADGRLTAAAQEALQLEGEPRTLRRLTHRWAASDFRDLPPVVLLAASAMPGATGAYAISRGLIYLNQDWLLGASREQIFAVLTEELGHHLDAQLNSSETPGDEGKFFASLLSSETPLTAAQRQDLQQQNDFGWIDLDGGPLTVEQAVVLTRTPIQPASPWRTHHEYGNQSAFAALKTDGSIVTWGFYSRGGDSRAVSSRIASGVSQIFSSRSAFAALKTDGSVVTWGDSDSGGDSSAVSSLLALGISRIFSTKSAFAALRTDGSVVTWGNSTSGGNSSTVGSLLASGVAQIFSSEEAFAALKIDGSVVTWGKSSSGGDSSAVSRRLSSGVFQIFSANDAFAALKIDGSVITWGNSSSSGGDSSAVRRRLSSGVSQIFSTNSAFAALKIDGSVVTWGNSSSGGDSSAVRTRLSSGVSQIFSNGLAFAALKTNGSVVTWGNSLYGANSSAVSSQLASGVSKIFSTSGAFAALKTDGSVVTWGPASYGGNSSAVRTRLSSGVSQIFATARAFAALKTDGSVVTWGYGYSSDSSAVSSRLSCGVSQIFSTASAFAALKTDGSVVQWGDSRYGGNIRAASNRLTSGVVAFANPFTDDRLIPESLPAISHAVAPSSRAKDSGPLVDSFSRSTGFDGPLTVGFSSGSDDIQSGAASMAATTGESTGTERGAGGRDVLTGQGGADRFCFSTLPGAFSSGQADQVTDFNSLQGDRLEISRTAFGITATTATLLTVSSSTAVAAALATPSLFIYDSSSGQLFWNANDTTAGSGRGGLLAVLTNAPALGAADIQLV